MALFTGHTITPDSALGGWQMKRSLRWEQNDSAYLSRTGSSPTGGGKYSYSSWIKRVDLGGQTCLWGAGGGSQTNTHAEGIYITGDNQVALIYRGAVGGGSVGWYAYSTLTLRDTTSWIHVMLTYDNNQSGISNKIKYYFNGVESAYGGGVGSPGDLEYVNKSGVAQYIGRMDQGGGPGYARVYQAETHVADGYIWTPSDFGYTDAQTGQWRPKRPEDISVNYGNNGFYLDYADNSSTSTLGIDRSGNSNNWTSNGFSVSAGYGNDSLEDTPTNNFCTMNHVDNYNSVITNGGLEMTQASDPCRSRGTSIMPPNTGKYYYEMEVQAGASYVFGMKSLLRIGYHTSGDEGEICYYGHNGNKNIGQTDGSTVSSSYGASYSAGDTVAILYDSDAGDVYFYKNNASQGLASTGINDKTYQPYVYLDNYGTTPIVHFNFGQRPFKYTPPTGARGLSSKNMATPVAAGVVKPQRHFGVLSWSGNDGSQTIDGLEFTPDFVWIKARRSGEHHFFTDIIRGAGHRLQSSSTAVESDRSSEFTSFVRGGFTIAGTHNEINGGGVNIIGMCWKAGGAAVSNSDGTITSSVSANTEAGFSIVSYTGNETNNATVGHGLGKSPDCVIIKDRVSNSAGNNWYVFHSALDSGHYVKLNQESASTAVSGTSNGGVGSVTSTTFNFIQGTSGNNKNVNESGDTFIAYCWAEIPGYSKFGKYIGNGSSDGPYVHLGFKPAFIIYKKSEGGSDNWEMQNTTIDTDNPVNESMYPNTSGAQSTGRNVDFLSNGFKMRNANGNTNEGSSFTYIYMAWAERPSGSMFGLDANAR